MALNHTKFMGYDKDEDGNLIINEKQAKIVRRIFADYLDGKGPNRIARSSKKTEFRTGMEKQNGMKAA